MDSTFISLCWVSQPGDCRLRCVYALIETGNALILYPCIAYNLITYNLIHVFIRIQSYNIECAIAITSFKLHNVHVLISGCDTSMAFAAASHNNICSPAVRLDTSHPPPNFMARPPGMDGMMMQQQQMMGQPQQQLLQQPSAAMQQAVSVGIQCRNDRRIAQVAIIE